MLHNMLIIVSIILQIEVHSIHNYVQYRPSHGLYNDTEFFFSYSCHANRGTELENKQQILP
jgi:hypothetical protein